MATLTGGNVISLENARTTSALTTAARTTAHRRIVTRESVGVLNDCRDIALKRIVVLLAGTFDTIEDELFDMAEKAGNRETQNLYLEARAQAHDNRGAIEAAFEKQFLGFFETKVTGEAQAADRKPLDYSSMTLSLVADSDLEEKIAIDEIARRLTDKCDEELHALSQRMGFLLSDPDMLDEANPLSPELVIRALKVACDQMTSGYQTKLTVLRLVEQHIAADMLNVYQEINSHLVARSILPNIRPGYRKAQTGVVKKLTPTAAASGLSSTKAPTPAATDTAGARENPAADVFATLQQLMSGGEMFDRMTSAGSSAPPAFGVTTDSFAPPPPHPSVSSPADALRAIADGKSVNSATDLVASLTRMQQQHFSEFKSALANAISMPATDEPTEIPRNVLRTVREQGVADGSPPLDILTIDIVAMLFDYIFADRGIPEPVKGLLARLQIPALKVAILDKSFFSRKAHPARRLLDVLANASVGLPATDCEKDAQFQKIVEVVDRLHNEFDTDIQLFAEVLHDFEKFLVEHEAAAAKFVEQSARVVHEHERREMARMIAIDETERRAAGAALPGPVLALLRGPWARVLERVYLRENGRTERFADLLATADSLIWSVAPKTNAEERKRLIGILPALLKNLQVGMDVAAVDTDDRSRFFSALVDCHAAAVKAGLRGDSVASLLAAATPANEFTPLFAKLVSEECAAEATRNAVSRFGAVRIQFTEHGVEIRELCAATRANDENASAPGATAHAGGGETAHVAHVDFDITAMAPVELKCGTWAEFVGPNGRSTRAKLTWISPLKGVYLFTNPGTSEAISISPEALQQKLASAEARLLDDASLIDRAVDSMVNSLRAARA